MSADPMLQSLADKLEFETIMATGRATKVEIDSQTDTIILSQEHLAPLDFVEVKLVIN